MSQPGVAAKKLLPAKKALKRIARTLRTKLHDFNLSKAIKAIKTKTSSLIAYCSLHFFHPFNKRSIATKSRYRSRQFNHLYQYYNNKNQSSNSFSPIYIDQLYAAESASSAQPKRPHLKAETSGEGKQVADEKAVTVRVKPGKGKEKILHSIEDAWREVVAKSPQLRPVDERAEEFIYKFREDIKLEKEISAAEYQEMLQRSA